MPIYFFKNPKTGKVKEVVQKMNDNHVYSEDGVLWERIFTVPQTNIDTKIDPFDSRSFCNKTRGKSETIGDLMDRSKEMAHKRESIAGYDPVKQKFYEDYSKTRNGKKHKDDPSNPLNKKIESKIFSVE